LLAGTTVAVTRPCSTPASCATTPSRIKEHTLAHLDRYLEQLEASVKRLGGHVHWAATAEDAKNIVANIAKTSWLPDGGEIEVR